MTHIAIIGGGPTAIYTLKGLTRARKALSITLFEREPWAGPGMPYRDGTNDPAMLANIASREVPRVTRTLAKYLHACDDGFLRRLGLTRDAIDEDSFYPRVVLGSFFTAELAEVVARLRGLGHTVTIRTKARVTDIVPARDGVRIEWQSTQRPEKARFHHVVIATGHDWTDFDEEGEDESALLSPWPAERLRALSGEVGILGSSLTAIDVAVTVASSHGVFEGEDGDETTYAVRDGTDPFKLTMMSRKGLLPEADWYYPLPLPALAHFTPAAVADLVGEGPKRPFRPRLRASGRRSARPRPRLRCLGRPFVARSIVEKPFRAPHVVGPLGIRPRQPRRSGRGPPEPPRRAVAGRPSDGA